MATNNQIYENRLTAQALGLFANFPMRQEGILHSFLTTSLNSTNTEFQVNLNTKGPTHEDIIINSNFIRYVGNWLEPFSKASKQRSHLYNWIHQNFNLEHGPNICLLFQKLLVDLAVNVG